MQSLSLIKTSILMQELINRISDQLSDPEPQFDGVLSFLTEDELDWFMGELTENLDRRDKRSSKMKSGVREE